MNTVGSPALVVGEQLLSEHTLCTQNGQRANVDVMRELHEALSTLHQVGKLPLSPDWLEHHGLVRLP